MIREAETIMGMLRLTFSCCILIGVSACSGDRLTKPDIETILNGSLGPESTRGDVEQIFDSRSWIYDWDQYQSRYQARTPDGDSYCFSLPFYECGLQIYVFFNENRYLRYEVEQIYSGL